MSRSRSSITSEPPPSVLFQDTGVAFASKTDSQLRKAYILFAAFEYPWLVRFGSSLTQWLLEAQVPCVTTLIKKTVFEHFCGGESIRECQSAVAGLAGAGVKSILDYSVEGEKTEAGFEATAAEIMASIDWGAERREIAFSVFKVTGIARFGLLERLAAGEPLSLTEQQEWQRAQARVERICQRAHVAGVPVFIDGEETWIQDVIDGLGEALMARFNRERVSVYNTYQLYRRVSLENLRAACAQARSGGYLLGAKLVRGAYMEKERQRAEELGYGDPLQPDKQATDRAYDQAVLFCLDNLDALSLCAGTHNEESCQRLVRELQARAISPQDKRVYFSQLYGMSDNISFNLARAGYNVAKYLPYGPVRSVLPYLIRRAEENSAIAGQSGRELRLIQGELARRRGDAPQRLLPKGSERPRG